MKVRVTRNQSDDGRALSVTTGETYEVLGIECGDFRLIDDLGAPVLIDAAACEVVDKARPGDWVTTIEDGDEYAYPPEFSTPGFWERYHEHEPEALRVYSRYVNRKLRTTDAA